MDSRWSDADASETLARYAATPGCNEDIALRVYSSRLIGRDPSLVLHGGGNTSVKTRLVDDSGESVEVLCVKGSGWDLGDIEPAGLPAVRLATLRALRELDALSDEAMVNAQRTRLLDAGAPNPSVETLLHGFLPAKFIDHSHADAILAIVDQPEPEVARLCAELFGERLALVPYVMPGFALAKLAAEVAQAHPKAEGLLLLQHGLFTWGASARESYERHVWAVDVAERYIAGYCATAVPGRSGQSPGVYADRERDRDLDRDRDRDLDLDLAELAAILRGRLGEGQRRYFLEVRRSPAIARFLARPDLAAVAQRGPVTPDHVIRTKPVPLILDLRAAPSGEGGHAARAKLLDDALAGFRTRYQAYFADQAAARPERRLSALDPDPRVVLLPGSGVLLGVGTSAGAAGVAADLYEHTIAVIEAAEAVGRYQALPASDLFDMEYWSLEQAKLGKAKPRALDGQIVYISGAARGIGAAIARVFAAAGAALYLVDLDEDALAAVAKPLKAAYEVVDLSDEAATRASVSHCVRRYGGLDGLVSNAGFVSQVPIALAETALLEASFAVNFYAHQWLASAAWQVFERQRMGGFLLFNASKAAFNPGPEFGPYAIPKAALVALTKQYALEGGALGIRANAVNADRVRTGLMSAQDVERRAAARGLAVDAYFRSNLLGREVSAEDVAEAFLHLAVAKSTTGSVLTVDGGNIAASPR